MVQSYKLVVVVAEKTLQCLFINFHGLGPTAIIYFMLMAF